MVSTLKAIKQCGCCTAASCWTSGDEIARAATILAPSSHHAPLPNQATCLTTGTRNLEQSMRWQWQAAARRQCRPPTCLQLQLLGHTATAISDHSPRAFVLHTAAAPRASPASPHASRHHAARAHAAHRHAQRRRRHRSLITF